MWSALFGYPGPLSAALISRLIVFLVAGPWLILFAASAPGTRSPRMVAVRTLLLILLLDRLMADFRFWGPIVTGLATLWMLFSSRAVEGHSPGLFRPATACWLAAGLFLVVLSLNAALFAPVHYAVLLFVAFSLLGSWPQATPSHASPDTPEQAPSPAPTGKPWIGRAVFCLIATTPLYWSVPDFSRDVFLRLLVAGALGWIGVQFLCWRAGRRTQRTRFSLRGASWLSGLAAGFLLAVSTGEMYFRYIYDASDANGNLRTAQHWSQRHVRFNSWGYRDREIPPAAELEGLTRIVVLGDSFAFGWGIDNWDDLLSPRLERELTGKVSPPPRVFTLALGGIDTRRETAFFKNNGVLLHPRVVVLMYHLNDTDTLMPRPRRPWTASPAWWPVVDSSDFLEFFLFHLFLHRDTAQMTVMEMPGLPVYQNPPLFARQSKDLLALMGMIREAGASPVVVMYPYLSVPTSDGPQRYALDCVAEVLTGAGVPVIDVSKLVDVTDRRFHANPFDPHPSPALHAAVVPVLAEAVLNALHDVPATAPATAPAAERHEHALSPHATTLEQP